MQKFFRNIKSKDIKEAYGVLDSLDPKLADAIRHILSLGELATLAEEDVWLTADNQTGIAGDKTGAFDLTTSKNISAAKVLTKEVDASSGGASDLTITTGTTKTLVLTSATYDDLPPSAFSTGRIPGADFPTWTAFSGNINLYQFDVGDNLEPHATEITHQYKEGEDLEMHIHWATGGTDIDARAVKWEVEYVIASPGEAFSGATVSAEAVIPANTPDRTAFVTTIATINGSALKIGAYIVSRVKRIASTGTAPTADPFGIAIGFHTQMDTLGSRQMYIK